VRLGIIHNVDPEALVKRSAAGHLCMSCAIDVALATLDVGVTKMFVTKLLKEENVDALKSGAKSWEDLAVSVSTSCLYKISRFRPVSQYYIDVAYCYRPSSMLCRSVTIVSPAKMAEPCIR